MALEGTLRDMALVDLFEIFRLGNKSGILRLFTPGKESAIYVTMGRVIDAALYDTSTRQLILKGDEAVLQVLQWDSAEFTFTHDRSTVRHPVTVFQEIDQLVRLSVAPALPSSHAIPMPHMAMPISANLAFLYDLAPAGDTLDRQSSQYYRRYNTFSSAHDSSVLVQPAAAQVYRLDLVPLANEMQRASAVEPVMTTPTVLYERTAGQECAVAQVPQAPRPSRASVSLPGRKLLAAVMRRVRAL